MVIKYYYIDDDSPSTIEETGKGLSINNSLNVIPYQHRKWDEMIDFLIENQTEFDGLLMDWSLKNKNETGEEANYDISALVQQLRKLITDKKKFNKDFPILLCSAAHNFQAKFDRLGTSHDLFDEVFEKNDFQDDRDNVIKTMTGLASGYKNISRCYKDTAPIRSVTDMLGIDDLKTVDYRVKDHLISMVQKREPIHEIARFITNKIIYSPGPLVSEELLASRFGINLYKSQENGEWNKVIYKIRSTKYSGAFSEGWNRWWMGSIMQWWQETFNDQLGSEDGPERARLLNKKFKLKLESAQPTAKSRSTNFWFICSSSKVPLALEDGLLAMTDFEKAPWEEDTYYSIDAALELPANKVHPLERDRLKKLKKLYERRRRA